MDIHHLHCHHFVCFSQWHSTRVSPQMLFHCNSLESVSSVINCMSFLSCVFVEHAWSATFYIYIYQLYLSLPYFDICNNQATYQVLCLLALKPQSTCFSGHASVYKPLSTSLSLQTLVYMPQCICLGLHLVFVSDAQMLLWWNYWRRHEGNGSMTCPTLKCETGLRCVLFGRNASQRKTGVKIKIKLQQQRSPHHWKPQTGVDSLCIMSNNTVKWHNVNGKMLLALGGLVPRQELCEISFLSFKWFSWGAHRSCSVNWN